MYHVPNKTLPVNVATYPFRPMDPSWVPYGPIEEKSGGKFWRSIYFEDRLISLPVTRWGPKSNWGPSGGPCSLHEFIGVKISPHFLRPFFLGADDNSVDNDFFGPILRKIHWVHSITILTRGIMILHRWWFQRFFRGNDPIWLIFFRSVETTNQLTT